MNPNRRLWTSLAAVMIVSFAVLLLMGGEIYRAAPPVPATVVAESGRVLLTRRDIEMGRQVWQSMGGQQVGSIWGHGAYVAPDWSADWLHREAVALLDRWAEREHGTEYAALASERQAALRDRLRQHVRGNGYDEQSDTLLVSDDRAAAIEEVATHYRSLFGADPAFASLRDDYAIAENPIPDPERRTALTAFFFWTAWAAAANRPGDHITYTNNWPPEPLLDLAPTPASFVWTIVSIALLLAGVGALCWYYVAVRSRQDHAPASTPDSDPLQGLAPTPSMRATAKYFWTVVALLGLQVVLGAITAHYAVEGQAFYGFQLADILPYAVARTWHTQLAVFWIATAWLATGLYIAPAISGHEPRLQRLLVNVLYVCLLVIVLGSMVGEWLGVQQRLGLDANFWFGHQGYEYVDLGRFWQIFLFVGLMLWLVLVCRALWPALRRRDESRELVLLLFLSTVAIGLFYGAGLMWGKHTHLALVEYWRWWVVHLWVEGFFEVFATAVIALLFTRLGLLGVRIATTAVVFSTVVFLTGGILGTFHHLYFSGTPTAVLALGATFSALEVVPLVLIGFEAYENYRLRSARPWVRTYKWPILFFIAVAFWNLVGAGVFGFLINPPLALYYMQGLNTTPNHGHTALFGVYGMLGLGLMLFCLRGLVRRAVWDERVLKLAFWSLNIGLAAMAFLSLLPIGLLQVYASVKHGLWYARSAELIHSPAVEALVWMRVPGDVVFSLGVAAIAWFVLRLYWPARARAVSMPLAAPATETLR